MNSQLELAEQLVKMFAPEKTVEISCEHLVIRLPNDLDFGAEVQRVEGALASLGQPEDPEGKRIGIRIENDNESVTRTIFVKHEE